MLCSPSDYYPEITDQGVKDLYKLAEIVRNSHFRYVVSDKDLCDEITEAAICKAVSFLKTSSFDPARSSLKNVLYTAMRNEMKNTLYRLSKDFAVDDEIMSGINEAPQSMDSAEVYLFFNDSEFSFVPYRYIPFVKSTLNAMGFTTTSEERRYYKEVERWVAMVIWRKIRDDCQVYSPKLV